MVNQIEYEEKLERVWESRFDRYMPVSSPCVHRPQLALAPSLFWFASVAALAWSLNLVFFLISLFLKYMLEFTLTLLFYFVRTNRLFVIKHHRASAETEKFYFVRILFWLLLWLFVNLWDYEFFFVLNNCEWHCGSGGQTRLGNNGHVYKWIKLIGCS